MKIPARSRRQQDDMKKNLISLSRRYVAALRKHLQQGPRAIPPVGTALEIGRRAAALGLETLELARIHEQALATLELSRRKPGVLARAEIFFTEAITPIVETHRAAQQSKVHLGRLKKTLGRRTAELAATNRRLQQGVIRRKVMADAYEKSGQRHDHSLKESLQLQNRLRELTHRVLAAQEDERHKISHELQDEIAQTLLGINVRLLSMKQTSRRSTKGLKDEIASTQRLVANSARSVRRFARELDLPQPAQSLPSMAALPKAAAPGSRRQRMPVSRIMKTTSSSAQPPENAANAAAETNRGAPASRSFPVIAMAASAGGLKALSVILGALPADFPAPIAIVMHLAPDHKSILAEILNRRTHLVVKEAHTGDVLCPANVFIAPPNHHLLVAKDGRLKLSTSSAEKVHYARPSAEPLFASVAEVYQKNAIAVVLTGGDGDGSFGVQIIKERGGQVIAQDRPTSQDFSMPETAIKTGDVDFILPLDRIAPKLIELVEAGGERKNGRTPAKKPKADLKNSPRRSSS